MLLMAVGVPRETVLADYMVTLEHFDFARLEVWVEQRVRKGQGEALSGAAIKPLLAHAEYLEAGLDAVEERYGSVAHYLRDAGVTDGAVAALRDVLVAGP